MQAISKVVFAATAVKEENIFSQVRLAFGSVAATPVRATSAESFIEGKKLDEIDMKILANKLFEQVQPLDDIRSEASYREKVAFNLVTEFLRES